MGGWTRGGLKTCGVGTQGLKWGYGDSISRLKAPVAGMIGNLNGLQGRFFVPFLLVLALVLSGCSGNAQPPVIHTETTETIGEGDCFDADRGCLRGVVVVQDEQLPIRGARVEVKSGPDKRVVVTNIEGAYVIEKITPGLYTIEVTVAAEKPVEKSIGVDAGAETFLKIDVAITAISENAPWQVTTHESGYMACDVGGLPCPNYPGPNDKRQFEHHFEGKPVGFLYEFVWKRPVPGVAGPLGDNGQPGWIHRWEFEANLGTIQKLGRSAPPYFRLWMEAPADWDPEDDLPEGPTQVRVSSFDWYNFLQLPGYAYEQEFEVHMTAFYVESRVSSFCGAGDDCPG